LNKYGYTEGRPTVAVDPSGEFSLVEVNISNAILGYLSEMETPGYKQFDVSALPPKKIFVNVFRFYESNVWATDQVMEASKKILKKHANVEIVIADIIDMHDKKERTQAILGKDYILQSGNPGVLSDEDRNLLTVPQYHIVDNSNLNLFFVKGVERPSANISTQPINSVFGTVTRGIGGASWWPRLSHGLVGAAISSRASYSTVAHEMGHILLDTGRHPWCYAPNSDYLMWWENPNSYNLTPQAVNDLRQSPYVR